MRALLAEIDEYGPAFARLYGLLPKDYGSITPAFARALIADIHAIEAAARG